MENLESPDQVGKPAPEFALKTTDGTTVSLKSLRGKKVVLYFYPKDESPGCTKEACSFRDNSSILKSRGVEVLGVSLDSIESHRRFADINHLPFPLLSDPDAVVSKSYGVYKLRNFGGKEFMGIERSTFIIDEQGKLVKEFRGVNVDNHIAEILDSLPSSR